MAQLKALSTNYNAVYFGWEFRNGVAEIPEGEEEKAKRIAQDFGYEFVEDKPKKQTKKQSGKKAETKKEGDE
ncbi:hypothetical protein [Halobacillus ihumii]|uniref:hypothetical protein n=1 Tax=Halobacillus ihumii TaxID=2686092 RepID=UPI0013D20D60|nr:hypothetical protein [Halobacillus ihumii]